VEPTSGVTTPGSPHAYESQVAGDLARRALLVAPAVVIVAGLVRGVDGAASALVGLALVSLNFLLAARLIGWAAGKSMGAVYGTVMGGYVLRLGALLGIVVGLERVSWIDVPVLVITIAVTHLALLVWEMRYVSLSLAAPGLKPSAARGRLGGPLLAGGHVSSDTWTKE
jgi:hypothetical protein